MHQHPLISTCKRCQFLQLNAGINCMTINTRVERLIGVNHAPGEAAD